MNRTRTIAVTAAEICLGAVTAAPAPAVSIPDDGAVGRPSIGHLADEHRPGGPRAGLPHDDLLPGGEDPVISSVPTPLRQVGANAGSPGLGAWTQRGAVVTFRFQRFFTRDGVLVARQLLVGTTTVSKDGTTQSGPATATFFAPDGTTPMGAPVKIEASGTRMRP